MLALNISGSIRALADPKAMYKIKSAIVLFCDAGTGGWALNGYFFGASNFLDDLFSLGRLIGKLVNLLIMPELIRDDWPLCGTNFELNINLNDSLNRSLSSFLKLFLTQFLSPYFLT